MTDHDRYEVTVTIAGNTHKFYVAVSHLVPDEYVPNLINDEVFNYINSNLSYYYHLKLV